MLSVRPLPRTYWMRRRVQARYRDLGEVVALVQGELLGVVHDLDAVAGHGIDDVRLHQLPARHHAPRSNSTRICDMTSRNKRCLNRSRSGPPGDWPAAGRSVAARIGAGAPAPAATAAAGGGHGGDGSGRKDRGHVRLRGQRRDGRTGECSLDSTRPFLLLLGALWPGARFAGVRPGALGHVAELVGQQAESLGGLRARTHRSGSRCRGRRSRRLPPATARRRRPGRPRGPGPGRRRVRGPAATGRAARRERACPGRGSGRGTGRGGGRLPGSGPGPVTLRSGEAAGPSSPPSAGKAAAARGLRDGPGTASRRSNRSALAARAAFRSMSGRSGPSRAAAAW